MLDETARAIEPNPAAVGALERRLHALASAPAVIAELERQARETSEAHRAAIETLRAAEKRFIELESARDAKVEAVNAKFAPIEQRYFRAREEHATAIREAFGEVNAAQDLVSRALSAINALPPWRKFEVWKQRIEESLSYAYLHHDLPPRRFADGHPAPWEKQTPEWREAVESRRASADAALLGFRALVNTARTVFCSEEEALEAAKAALEPVKAVFTLPPGLQWPSDSL
jgi:hypothetical protein